MWYNPRQIADDTRIQLPQNTAHDDTKLNYWNQIMTLRAVLYRLRERALLPIGVTPEQAGILQAIFTLGTISPAQISRGFFREPHTISSLLKRMAEKGMVNLTKDTNRRNQIRVGITERGEELRKQSLEALDGIDQLFDQIDPKELEVFITTLEKIFDLASEKYQKMATSGLHRPRLRPVYKSQE